MSKCTKVLITIVVAYNRGCAAKSKRLLARDYHTHYPSRAVEFARLHQTANDKQVLGRYNHQNVFPSSLRANAE